MSRILKKNSGLLSFVSLLAFSPSNTFGQASTQTATGVDSWVYLLLGGAGLAIIGAGAYWFKNKTTRETKLPSKSGDADIGTYSKSKIDSPLAKDDLRRSKVRPARPKKLSEAYQHSSPAKSPDLSVNESALKNLVQNPAFARFPVSTFLVIKNADHFEPLPFSHDPGLLTAIEETQEDFEDDAEIRDLSLRILAGTKASNSAEALSQIALYDFSAALRSKAVSTLAEFDHESVFETIVLACADPTREVRAAAARGLFRLSFDRADAWTRIAESKDESGMRQLARAAIEAGLAERSLERLIHLDDNVAYEAFALIALLIKARETELLFAALAEHKDDNVKLAILHVIEVAGEPSTVERLEDLAGQNLLSPQISERVRKVLESFAGLAV
ncbi:MAG: HEAT repeat domain-containing protein [Saprospiraceae bacterium]|nr:HEAT repeat domain-containing protein [Pyrinomonadaceae bacterium]